MKEVIEDIVIGTGAYDCLCDPYDKYNTGDNTGSVLDDCHRLVEITIKDAMTALQKQVTDPTDSFDQGISWAVAFIKDRYGIN